MRRSLLLLIAVTTAFEALRAGSGTFRMLIDMPSRSRIGTVAFAEFSRATDLSTRGIVFYVLYGFGGAVLTCSTWAVTARTRAPLGIRRLAMLSAMCSLVILALTTQAAPLMWQVGRSNDPVLLANVLDQFTAWTTGRVLCADVSFAAMLAALTTAALRRQAT